MTDARMYPDRPYLAVSAAIIRDGHVLVARRARGASTGVFTMPGGVVEAGETLHQAIMREVMEETGIVIEPVALAGEREFITRDATGRVARHFVILCFACRWISGEGVPLLEELSELRWLRPAALAGLQTTEGLAEIVDSAFAVIETAPVVRSD
jgi:8-oxo-dGTP diphosphatase